MSKNQSERMKHALQDPKSIFAQPADVLADDSLKREEKIEILQRWEADANLLATAEAENMAGGESNLLHEVMEALASLLPESAADR